MEDRLSKLKDSLRRIGEMDVSELDFIELLNKDIEDLHFARSLRQLGQIKVTDWNFPDVMPAVNRLAHTEVDVVKAVKRAAAYKVLDWDFKSHSKDPGQKSTRRKIPAATPEQAAQLIERLKGFLAFVSAGLIEQPQQARIEVIELEPALYRFRLILQKRDASALIGHGGHSAAAIRRIMQTIAAEKGIHILLNVLGTEEAATGKGNRE